MRQVIINLFLIAGILPCVTFGQSLSDTVAYSEKRVEETREHLNEVREAVTIEKRPLLEHWTTLQGSVISKRREAESQDSATSGLRAEVEKMEADAKSFEQSLAFIRSRLIQARSDFESSLTLAERPRFEELLLLGDPTKTTSSQTEADELELLLSVVKGSLDRLDNSVGGTVYKGKANVGDLLETGNILQIGPFAFFTNGESGGILLEDELMVPELRNMGDEVHHGISRIINGGTGSLIFDPSMGEAFALADSTPGFLEHIKTGGVWMFPIFFFGVLSLAIALHKYIEVRKVVVPQGGLIDELVQDAQSDDEENFLKNLESMSRGIRPVFQEGFFYREYSENTREAAMHQEFISFRSRLEARLSLISVTAAVSPLLGLLGTVTGMIKTFHLISLYGSGDARALSSGISEALVTTEYGLIVAIPALLFHALLSRKTKGIVIGVAALIDKFNKTVSGK